MLAVSMSNPLAHFQPAHKRPKLSLQTSSLAITYGGSSKALSTIATPTATTTPTTLNTFTNTYDLSYRPSPISALESVRSARISRSQSPRPTVRKTERSTYSLSLPFGIKPILKNSALRHNPISASPCSNARKVFFPQPKHVGFKRELEEEIVTEIYVARHSDLLLADSENQTEDLAASVEADEVRSESEETETETTITAMSPRRKRKFQSHGDSEISISAIEVSTVSKTSTDTSSDVAATPCSSGGKKRRWEWTLAPVEAGTPGVTETPVAYEDEDDDGVDSGIEVRSDLGSDWVMVCRQPSSQGEEGEDRPRKRRAISLDIRNGSSATKVDEPVLRIVKAASW